MLTMSMVVMVEVLRKMPPDVTEGNLLEVSDRLVGRQNSSNCKHASTGYVETLVYQPLPVATKEVWLELKVCQLA